MKPLSIAWWPDITFGYRLPDGTTVDVEAEIRTDEGKPYVYGISTKIRDTEIDFNDIYIRPFAKVEMVSVHTDIENEALALWMG